LNNIDLVVVGAGSAGCIVTNQIINKTNFKTLLVEAGHSDNSPVIKIPLGYGMTFFNEKVNWNFYSKKQKNLSNREIYFPRGKILGGSGSINAMIYTRGLESDYENWSNVSNNLWSWNNIKSSYEAIEKIISEIDKTTIYNKIPVNDVSKFHHPIVQNFFEASKEMGITINKNLNTDSINQVGHYNTNTRNGYRFTSSDGFLKPILRSKNLIVLKNSIAKEIIFHQKKISQITIINNGKEITIKPKIGVILCAGSIMTPHLLMHSGIGPANKLKEVGINVKLDSPNVGSHLQDHIGIDYLYKSKVNTLNYLLGRWKGRATSILEYLLKRKGPLSLSINQSGGFINWKSKDKLPNLQLYFNPISYSISYHKKRPLLKADKFNGFAIGFNSCKPKSRGSVFISTNKFNDFPIIDPNYLSDQEDIYDLQCAFDIIRKLSVSKHISEINNGSINIDPLQLSDEELINHFRKKAVSVYHPCGTCRMDNDIQKGVVSEKLKVHGAENLWIADASIFPNITSGNINAPVMMMAYRGSQLIINDIINKYL